MQFRVLSFLALLAVLAAASPVPHGLLGVTNPAAARAEINVGATADDIAAIHIHADGTTGVGVDVIGDDLIDVDAPV